MRNAVVVLDAFDGTLLKSLPTVRSVAAPATLMDTDADRYIDRGYAADLRGNVFRVDFESALRSSAASDWVITKFVFSSAASPGLKFFYAPDVVQTQMFTPVLLGSGDREAAVAPDDCRPILCCSITARARARLPVPRSRMRASSRRSAFNLAAAPNRCYLDLDVNREKVVTSAVSASRYTYFSTNMPTVVAAYSCASNLGTATSHRIALFCSAAIKSG